MVLKKILVLLGNKLLKLINNVFELIFCHNVILDGAWKHKNFKLVFAFEAIAEHLNKLEALVIDRSLLLELKDCFVVHHSVVGAGDDRNDEIKEDDCH